MTSNWLYMQIFKLKAVPKPTFNFLQVSSHWAHMRECVKTQGTIHLFCLGYDLGWDMTGLCVHGHVAHMAGAGIFPNSPEQLKSIFFQQTMHPLSSLLNQSTPACCFSSPLCCWLMCGFWSQSHLHQAEVTPMTTYMSDQKPSESATNVRFQIHGSYNFHYIWIRI